MNLEIQDEAVQERDVLDILDPSTQNRISFPTRSDALLAELILKHGFSRHHFDLVLNILHDRSFSLQEVSIRDSGDVDGHISEHRFSLAQRRSARGVHLPSDLTHPQPSTPNATTSMVFNLLLEHMLSSLPHFSHEADTPRLVDPVGDSASYHTSLTHSLRSLSLVHRSWTPAAQRALSRRVVLPTRRRLRTFSRSPACSSNAGVREIIYKVDRADAAALLNDRLVAREHWTLLASVLRRFESIRFLCLRVERAHPADLAGLEKVLQVVGGLVSLEGLWLLSVRDHCPFLPNTCAILPKLENLRFLSLFNWSCPSGSSEHQNEPPSSESPPKSLKALQLRDSYLVIPPTYLSWLFTPQADYTLHTLDLQITFAHLRSLINAHGGGNILNNTTTTTTTSPTPTDTADFLTALDPLLDSLTDLAVRLFYLDVPIHPGNAFARARTSTLHAVHDLDLQQILTRSKALQRVRLHRLPTCTTNTTPNSISSIFDNGHGLLARTPGTPSIPFELPASLEELHMHYTYAGVNWRTQDKRLASALSIASTPLFPPTTTTTTTWKGPEGSSLPPRSLRRVLVSAGEFDMPSRAGVVSDKISEVCRMPRTAEVCAVLGVEFVPLDGVYLNQYVVDLLR